MTYIVNATDPSRPLDTDPRKQGAEELRALKLRVNQLQSALEGADTANAGAASAAAGAASAALAAANAAQGSANAAQGTADAAVSAASAAQGTADSALSSVSNIAFNNVSQLTGSGDWVVPSGVTQVLALIYSGGTASGSKGFYVHYTDFGYGQYTIDLAQQVVGHYARLIAVTPAQVISYECGAGDVVRTDYANIAGNSPNILQSVAQATRFGTDYARPAVPDSYQVAVGSLGISAVPRTQARQVTLHPTVYSVTAIHTGAWYDGEAGRIVLLY